MNIQTLINGDLEMSATKKEQKEIKKIGNLLSTFKSERIFVAKFLEPLGYKRVIPEDIGALTSCTCITDGKNVWGDMQYAVASFLDTLADGGTVTWTKG